MQKTINPTESLLGRVSMPPDKSIAHRTALLSAIAEGTSQIVNYPTSADPQSTLSCLKQLGIEHEQEDGILYVHGKGLQGLQPSEKPLDCGNSGTTMRLISGILAGQEFDSTLIGDASLSKRPMARIANPLKEMGATIELTEGHAPIKITGNPDLRGITYELPVASAQVKSCVLLAGLYANEETTVIESKPSRDHTERMLGLSVFSMGDQRHISIEKGHRIPARTWSVPRDFSAAAFFLTAGCIVPNSELRLQGVGLNATRSAFLDVLQAMGGQITIENEREFGGEPIADLVVRSSPLHAVKVGGELVPILIDEVPILAVAAAFASGRTEIRDAHELRVKETDRIDAMVKNLRLLGADVEEFEDGLAVTGGQPLKGTTVDCYDDHRIAMAMGIAGLRAEGETTIKDAHYASVSFPDFWDQLEEMAA